SEATCPSFGASCATCQGQRAPVMRTVAPVPHDLLGPSRAVSLQPPASCATPPRILNPRVRVGAEGQRRIPGAALAWRGRLPLCESLYTERQARCYPPSPGHL